MLEALHTTLSLDRALQIAEVQEVGQSRFAATMHNRRLNSGGEP